MRNLKNIALVAALAFGGAVHAATDGATLTLQNSAVDTITAGDATLNWTSGSTASGSGSLAWTTPGVSDSTRKITAQLSVALAEGGPITGLTATVGAVTGTATAANGAVTLSTTGANILTGIAKHNTGSTTISYSAALSE